MINYTYPLFRPPAEANSIIIQITEGCSHNKCRFCGMYKRKKFSIRNIETIKKDIESIPFYLLNSRKVFLADGDGLSLKHSNLLEILILLKKELPRLRRVSIYATTSNILKFSDKELIELKKMGLNLFYIGLESGHDPLLKFINKGNNCEEFIEAMEKLNRVGIKSSVTAILGLGGKKFTRQHSLDTAEIINLTSPTFFSLLTLIIGDNDNYIKEISLLNRYELIEELKTIVENININTIFRTDHGSNFVDASGTLIKDKSRIVDKLNKILIDEKDNPYFHNSSQITGEL